PLAARTATADTAQPDDPLTRRVKDYAREFDSPASSPSDERPGDSAARPPAEKSGKPRDRRPLLTGANGAVANASKDSQKLRASDSPPALATDESTGADPASPAGRSTGF